MKINFDKVEKMLDDCLMIVTARQLLNLAVVASKIGQTKDKSERTLYLQKIALIRFDLLRFKKRQKKIFEQLKTSSEEITTLLEQPFEKLSAEQLQRIDELSTLLEKFKAEARQANSPLSNEDLIAREQKRHIKKRFNVTERWIPLD